MSYTSNALTKTISDQNKIPVHSLWLQTLSSSSPFRSGIMRFIVVQCWERSTLTKANLNWWRTGTPSRKTTYTELCHKINLNYSLHFSREGRGKITYRILSHLSQPYSLSCLLLSQGTGFTALLGLSKMQLPLQTSDSWLMGWYLKFQCSYANFNT